MARQPHPRPRADEPKNKATKVEAKEQKFKAPNQIRSALENPEQDALKDSLTLLRNQLTIHSKDVYITPQDERLVMARAWAGFSPGLPELCNLLNTHSQNATICSLVVTVISNILLLLSSNADAHSSATPLLKHVFSPAMQRRLNGHFNGAHNELIMATLKLYNTLSTFGSGKEQKQTMESFPWGFKTLPKLLYMRRKGGKDLSVDLVSRPDIRTLFIQFLLSFISRDSSTITKTTVLEQHRDVFSSIFKGLHQDPHVVARYVLEVCWEGIWNDPRLRKTLKIAVFHEAIFQQIMKLYERTTPEVPTDPESVPADLGHHFMLALTTKPGFGICFKDRGWYPREADSTQGDEQGQETYTGSSKIYNKILSNILKSLKVNEDPRHHELALRILSACPELVSSYWSSSGLLLEPRLSSKWVTNIAILGSIISLPMPVESFTMTTSHTTSTPSTSKAASISHVQYQPSPPPLHAILENILPSMLTKSFSSKGLQHASPLVQHMTSLALIKCLTKYNAVVENMKYISTTLEEGEEGQWHSRCQLVQREIRKRLPDYRVIVSFSQQTHINSLLESNANIPEGDKSKALATTRNKDTVELLSESALRLMWLYQRCMPQAVAEVRFDTGKLLSMLTTSAAADSSQLDVSDTRVVGIHLMSKLCQIHVLRLLKNDTYFTWSSKLASSNRSYLHLLLMMTVKSESYVIRAVAADLVSYLLSHSILFEHDPDEVTIWLESLPQSVRKDGASAPDGSPLPDEGTCFIAFLDDCMQHCIKSPYHYLEKTREAASDSPFVYTPQMLPSPLLMTVMEQLDLRILGSHGSTLLASDVLTIVTALRKFIFLLTGKQPSLSYAKTIANRLVVTLESPVQQTPGNWIPPLFASACRKQAIILLQSLDQLENPIQISLSKLNQDSDQRLSQLESVMIGLSARDARIAAFEILDYIKLRDFDLGEDEIRSVLTFVHRIEKSLVGTFLDTVDPRLQLVWSLLEEVEAFHDPTRCCLFFESLFVRASIIQLNDPKYRKLLAGLFLASPSGPDHIRRRFVHLSHRLNADSGDESSRRLIRLGIINMIQSIAAEARSRHQTGFELLKQLIFTESSYIRDLCGSRTLDMKFQEAVTNLVVSSLDSRSQSDCFAVSEFSTYWLQYLKDDKHLRSPANEFALLWIPFMQFEDLIALLELYAPDLDDTAHAYSALVVTSVLQALTAITSDISMAKKMQPYIPTLFGVVGSPSGASAESLLVNVIGNLLPLGLDGVKDIDATSLNQLLPVQYDMPDGQSTLLEASFISWLDVQTWNERRDRIFSSLLYLSAHARESFYHWLQKTPFLVKGDQMMRSLNAYFDVGLCLSQSFSEIFWEDCSLLTELLCWVRSVYEKSKGVDSLKAHLRSSTFKKLIEISLRLNNSQAILFASQLQGSKSFESLSLLLSVLARVSSSNLNQTFNTLYGTTEHIIPYLIEKYSDSSCQIETLNPTLFNLELLASKYKAFKPHLVEPLLLATVQHRISSTSTLLLAIVLVDSLSFKPAIINKVLQAIVNHPKFISSALLSARLPLVRLVDALFRKHPNNTCHLTHISPLLSIYRGMDDADRIILNIFHMYEEQRQTSVASILLKWRPSQDLNYEDAGAIEIILNLDSTAIFKSCHNFTSGRQLALRESGETPVAGDGYDPAIILLLTSHALAQQNDMKPLKWIELFRTNVFSLVIRCLSLKDKSLRRFAVAIIGVIWQSLRTVDFLEKEHTMYILDMVRDILPMPANEPPRLPSHLSLLLAYALRGVYYPSNFLFPHTSRYLLQRPEFDRNDLPMFLGLIYSSSDNWKKERLWMLRFIRDGMCGLDDWRLIRRRHVLELLASQFSASEGDKNVRIIYLEILFKISKKAGAVTTLVARHAWLSWMELQIPSLLEDEALILAKILESFTQISDHDLLDRLTDKNWRLEMHRCLRLLLTRNVSLDVLLTVSSALVELCDGDVFESSQQTLPVAMVALEAFEPTLQFPAQPLNSLLSTTDDESLTYGVVRKWAKVVENLWRVVMLQGTSIPPWRTLTGRLLIWRAYSGQEIGVAEWVRQQTVACVVEGRK